MRHFIDQRSTEVDNARIAYRVTRPGQHPSLHGVWWPRSHDLNAELPGLVDVLDSRGFMVEWMSFNERTWDTTPQQIIIAGRVIRLGLYRSIDPNMASLSGHDGRARIDLLVIPPASHPAVAAKAFAHVLNLDARSRPSVTLTAAAAAQWEDDNGSTVPRPALVTEFGKQLGQRQMAYRRPSTRYE